MKKRIRNGKKDWKAKEHGFCLKRQEPGEVRNELKLINKKKNYSDAKITAKKKKIVLDEEALSDTLCSPQRIEIEKELRKPHYVDV